MTPLLALLTETDTTSAPRFDFQTHLPAAIPMWVAMLLAALAAVLIIMLYRAQRKLASPMLILLLLGIRLTALLLIMLLMLQPSVLWTNTHRSPGTLWLVLDQSGSMGLRDPQSSAIEKLRWADALGYLPDSKRKSKPDVLAARAQGLLQQLKVLEPPMPYDAGVTQADHAAMAQLTESMADFSKRLQALADDLDADPQISSQTPLPAQLRETARRVDRGLTSAKAAGSLRDAINAFKFSDLRQNLTRQAIDLGAAADRLDKAYLSAHAGDTIVESALARVTGQSRAELVTQLLTAEERRKGAMADLLGQFRTRVVSFADAPQNIGELDPATREQALRSALIPGGKSTNIASALEMVNQQMAAEETASVVLVTDARQNVQGQPSSAAGLLARRGVRVFGLLIGSQERSADAAVDQVDAPDWIYKDDTLQVGATIRMDGLTGKTTTVGLFRDGHPVGDPQAVKADSPKTSSTVHFSDKPGEPGVYEYELRVGEVSGEVNLANNRQKFRVAVKKDRLAALLIDDVPRWEYQYLASYLGRDQRMKLQTVLFTPARIEGVFTLPPVKASPTNPKRDAQILPQTREEWQAFDFVILGDVPPDKLPREQQQFLATAVRDRGTTLIVVAGQRSMPARYADSPLADLLPVQMASDWTPEAMRHHMVDGFKPGIAPQGADTVLTQLGMDPAANAQAWNVMPPWYWHSEQTHAKDAATVLWTITDPLDNNPADSTLEGARKRALLSTMTVGRGRVLYLAGDQTWRLRQIDRDNMQERFWGQVVRWASGTSLPAGGKFVRFGAEPQRAIQGTPITVTARIFHEDLTPYNGLVFEAVASTKDTPPKAVDRVTLKESPNDPGTYRGTFPGLPAGDLEITLAGGEVERLLDTDPTVALRSVTVQIDPQLDLEHTNVDTDPELLAGITSAGGGVSLAGPYADVLAGLIPPTPITRTSVRQVGPFSDPAAIMDLPLIGRVRITFVVHFCILGLFVLLLTVEWAIRKRAGMI